MHKIILFFFIYISIYTYFALNLKKISQLKGFKFVASNFIIVLFASSFIIIKIFERNYNMESLKFFVLISMIASGILMISVTTFLMLDIIKLFMKFNNFNKLSIFIIGFISIVSLIIGNLNPKIKEINLVFPELNTDRFVIVHLSDLHILPTTNIKNIEYILQKVEEIQPDIVVITGDIFDTKDVKTYIKYNLSGLASSSKYGAYAVSGNHEYYTGIDNFDTALKYSNIKRLDNESVNIDNKIMLSGINDTESGENIQNILKKMFGRSLPIIFLSHRPEIFDLAKKYGVFLQLSGHTHAGQIPPFDIIIKLFFKYFKGLYHQNNSYLYVTSGTRYWGPPMRLFSRSEIVKIILTKKPL